LLNKKARSFVVEITDGANVGCREIDENKREKTVVITVLVKTSGSRF